MSTIKPITKTAYSDKRWLKSAGYQFAAQDTLATLVVQEMPKAALILPLAFTTSNDKTVPVAIQGVTPGRNLLVDDQGKWRVGYVPAVYRSHPFRLGHTEDGPPLLCIDEDSGLVNDSEGEAFFDDNGEPTEAIRQVFNFLVQVHRNQQSTDRICATLQQHNLIEPWPITLKTTDGDKPVQGLHRINEKQLNQLDDESFVEIRKVGALPLIYCQLLSMQHLPNLVKLAASLQAKAEPALDLDELPDIDKMFGKENDLFHFD